MKKLFIVLASALLAVNVNAAAGDMVLSGSLGLGIGSNALLGTEEVEVLPGFPVEMPIYGDFTKFSIAPNFTYFLSDKFGVGGFVSFESNKYGDADAVNTFGVGVFGRYYVLKAEKFGIFGQATLGFGFPKDQTNIGFNIKPGVQYFINKKWSVELAFAPVLSLGYEKPKDVDGSTNFNLNVNPFDLEFSPLQLTLNYHF